MNYSIGQRVKVVGGIERLVGLEGCVVCVGTPAWAYAVRIPGTEHLGGEAYDGWFPRDVWGFDPHEIVPLAPPAADTWAAEKVKQVTRPIHEPTRTKEPA